MTKSINPVMEQNIKKQPKKVFKGKIEFTLTVIDDSTPELLAKTTQQRQTDKTDRHFHQRMLRAYLKGHEFFNFGRDLKGYPITHEVLFAWE